MLKVEQLEKSYPGFRLEDISLELPAGYMIGVLGENGAGKSTLLKLMMGYEKPGRGRVLFAGEETEPYQNIWQSPETEKWAKDQFGFVLNEPLFSPYSTLSENGMRYGKYYSSYREEELAQRLQEFMLDSGKCYGKCSRGEKLKFQFAFALSHHPRLLFLDEPLASFDEAFREKFVKHLARFVEDGRHSVIMASHLTQELEQMADYIVFLHKGKLLEFEDIETLREKYRVVSGEAYKIKLLNPDWVLAIEEGAYSTRAFVRHNSRRKYDRALTVEPPTLEDIFYYLYKKKPAPKGIPYRSLRR